MGLLVPSCIDLGLVPQTFAKQGYSMVVYTKNSMGEHHGRCMEEHHRCCMGEHHGHCMEEHLHGGAPQVRYGGALWVLHGGTPWVLHDGTGIAPCSVTHAVFFMFCALLGSLDIFLFFDCKQGC